MHIPLCCNKMWNYLSLAWCLPLLKKVLECHFLRRMKKKFLSTVALGLISLANEMLRCRWNHLTIIAENHSQHPQGPTPSHSSPLRSTLARLKVNPGFGPLNYISRWTSAVWKGRGTGRRPLDKSDQSDHKMTRWLAAATVGRVCSAHWGHLGWWFSSHRKYQPATDGLPPPTLSSNNTNPPLWMQTWNHTSPTTSLLVSII